MKKFTKKGKQINLFSGKGHNMKDNMKYHELLLEKLEEEYWADMNAEREREEQEEEDVL